MMSRAATDRLKCNPALGHLPALQYLLPVQLKVDAAYQRILDTEPSQSLVRKIAMFWNWDLCQPLVVARRENGDLYVIDRDVDQSALPLPVDRDPCACCGVRADRHDDLGCQRWVAQYRL